MSTMRAVYLPANGAWVAVWHGEIISLGGVRFFATRRDLDAALAAVRLQRRHSDIVAV